MEKANVFAGVLSVLVITSVVALPAYSATAVSAQQTVETTSVSVGTNTDLALNSKEGGVFATGYTGDLTVQSYDPDLTLEWERKPASAGGYGVGYSELTDTVYATGTNTAYTYDSSGNSKTDVSLGADMRSHNVPIDENTGAQYYGSQGTSDVIKKFDKDGNELWTYTTSAGYSDQIEYNQELGYVFAAGYGDTEDIVYALDSNGNELWTNTQLSERSVATEGGYAYVGEGGGELTQLDAETGNIIQSWNILGGGVDEVEVFDGIAYAGDGSEVVAYDLSNSEVLWSESISGFTEDIIIDEDGVSTSSDSIAVFYSDDGNIYKTITNQQAGGSPTKYQVSGAVSDNSGSPISNATVEINNGTNVVATAETNSDGNYSLSVENGTYDISATKSGYSEQTESINVTQDKTVNFSLEELDVGIRLELRPWMDYGSTQNYTVVFDNGTYRSDVTDNATVTSANSTIVSVDSVAAQLEATSNIDIDARTTVTANYTAPSGETYTAERNVTVANRTVENMQVLPTGARLAASLGVEAGKNNPTARTLQIIIVATIIAVAASLIATTWAGIATFPMVVTIGWLAGWVSNGILLVAVLMSLFVGLNIAANIDYAIR